MRRRSNTIYSKAEFYRTEVKPNKEQEKPAPQKTIDQLEKENEEEMVAQLGFLNTYYNKGVISSESETKLNAFLVGFLKGSILSEREDVFLFKNIKNLKRRGSLSVIQDTSTKQMIDNIVLSEGQNIKGNQSLDSNSVSTRQSLNSLTNNSTFLKLEQDQGQSLSMKYCLNEMFAQNIQPETQLKIMLISDNDMNSRAMISNLINEDMISSSVNNFEIQNKIFKVNNTKTVQISYFDTNLSFHEYPMSKSYYSFMDSFIYFINNDRDAAMSLNDLNKILASIGAAKRSIKPIVVVNQEAPADVINIINTLKEKIEIYNVDTSVEFNDEAFAKVITNITLRKKHHTPRKACKDDEFPTLKDYLHCDGGYSIEIKDNLKQFRKLGRSKSIKIIY